MVEPLFAGVPGGGGVFDVVVAGGGVIGLAAAWTLARDGRRVFVVDPKPGHGAVWVAAGMLAPANEAHFGEEPLVRLLVAGMERWLAFAPALEEDAGSSIGFEPAETVVVACDASDRAALDQLLAFRRSIGLDANRLNASECRRAVPALSPAICGGAEVPDEYQVDNRRLVAALLSACRHRGVEFAPAKVVGIDLDRAGAARGVRTEDGTSVAAGAVVAALGWQTGSLAGVPAGSLPAVRPVKGHILRLAGRARVLSRTVRGLVQGRSCYLVPRRDDSIVVGATVEEVGADLRVQAGAVHALLDDARALVPGIDELELLESAVGLRPGSADNAPHVGWTDVPGLAVATGHFRNGILLAPITGEAIGALVSGTAVPTELGPFGVVRTERPARARAPGG
jgi:glycine oxidase